MSCVFKSDSQNIGQEEELENEENRSIYIYHFVNKNAIIVILFLMLIKRNILINMYKH